MSDSDSDFEILAVSNSDGVFIDDKELLNNEFKKPKGSETTTPITPTFQSQLPNNVIKTTGAGDDEHFMDVEEDVKDNVNKNQRNTIVIDSQDESVNKNSVFNSDTPKFSSNDAAMNQLLEFFSEERDRGIMLITQSKNIQEARSNFEQSIIATRKLNNSFRDIQSKLSNVLIV